ncbi:MAG: M20/M25/M40 family metallo-hydrolase [Gemmatimonadota bacterium]
MLSTALRLWLPAPAVALLLLAAPPALSGQAQPDAAMVAAIRAEGLERSRAAELYHHLTDVIGPRLTASPAHVAAARWARDRLTAWGAADARLEPFEFGRGWTLEGLTLEMTAPRYFPLIGYPEAWTPSTRGTLEGEVLYLGERSVEEIRALADAGGLGGAIVLAERPQPDFITEDREQPADADGPVRLGAPRFLRTDAAAPLREVLPILREAGAGALLRPNQGQHGTVFVLGSRNTADDDVPEIILAAEHYNMLARLTEAGQAPTVRVRVAVRYHEEDTHSYNVLAEIPGTDPDVGHEVVMLGGHLDSWHSSPGATDNADGVTAALEAMRILLALDARPRRTIRIALWGGEEQGLLGARAWVEEHLAGEANAAAREAFSVYLNDDPGAGATYGFYMEENQAAKALFDAWLAPLRDLGVKRNMIEPLGSTDHLAFTRIGLPGFSTLKDYVDYDVRTHHTNMDFAERVTEVDLRQSAIVLAVFAWQAANLAERIPRAPR